MTRFVTKFDGRSYQDRCIELNLLPLCFRRDISDLVFLYKCLHDKIKIPIANYTQFIDNTSHKYGDCGLILKPLLTRTETFNGNDVNVNRCQLCVCNRMKNLFLWHYLDIFKYIL